MLSEMWSSDMSVCIVHYMLEQGGPESLPGPAEIHTSHILKKELLRITQL